MYQAIVRLRPWHLLLVTLAACLPALLTGYFGDDYVHHALLSPDLSVPRADDWSLFGLFSWVDGNPARNRILMDFSLIPWWTDENMHYAFWRPLSELTHWIDHQLWHQSPALMHLHNIVWYLALGGMLTFFYRRAGLSPVAVTVALLAFLLDSTHGFTVAWIANRNALIAAFCGVLSLHTFIAWREQDHRASLLMSLFFYSASLLAAEMGISTAAYLGAYALTRDPQGVRRGLTVLLPYVLITVAWWVIYKLGHFGANSSDAYYIDPIESPLLFLGKLVERVPILLFSQWGLLPAEIYGFSPGPIPVYVVIASVFVAGVTMLLLPLLRHHAHARFWGLGMLFSLAPIASALPHDRNLLMVGIGASALLGMLFEQLRDRAVASRWHRRSVKGLLGVHLLIAPLLLPLTAYSPKVWSNLMGLDRAAQLPVASHLEENILLVGLPLPAALGMIPKRFADQLPLPGKLWMLTSEPLDIHLQRTGENSLIVRAPAGMINGIEEIMRNLHKRPLTLGQSIEHTGMTLTVSELNENGHPTALTLNFAPLTLDRTRLLQWKQAHYEEIPIPGVGGELQLSWVDNIRH